MMSELRNNQEQSRYEMDEAGAVTYADYRLAGDRMYLDYVFAPPQLRGTGAAGRLMAAVASEARRSGLKITPICGYAAAWLRRSHEFRIFRRQRLLCGWTQIYSAADHHGCRSEHHSGGHRVGHQLCRRRRFWSAGRGFSRRWDGLIKWNVDSADGRQRLSDIQ